MTLVVEGTQLGDRRQANQRRWAKLRCSAWRKVIVPAPGEWGTEWVKVDGSTTPVLVNTDGRIIQRFEEYDDDDQPIEGKYAYYTVRDIHGGHIRMLRARPTSTRSKKRRL